MKSCRTGKVAYKLRLPENWKDGDVLHDLVHTELRNGPTVNCQAATACYTESASAEML